MSHPIEVDGDYLVVNGRRWWGKFYSDSADIGDTMWEMRRFVVHFESKWYVSVIWGYCTYSSNYELPFYNKDQEFLESPLTVEVGVLHADRHGLEGDQPYGYLDSDLLEALLIVVSRLSTNDQLDLQIPNH